MAALLKDCYDRRYIGRLAEALNSACPAIESARFSDAVFACGWPELELKQRMRRIAEALHTHVPGRYRDQLQILRAIAPSFTGFEGMFFPDFVERYGLDDMTASLDALGELTRYSSSEFAVRPFLLRYPRQTLAQLMRWAASDDDHRRRLASEGCRPRLPWAMRLPALIADPTPILPILERLRDDPSESVRRSVANNLNDIAKDHPDIVIDVARRWLGSSAATDRLVKHACRTLLKRGDARALQLFDHRPVRLALRQFRLDRRRIAIGEALEFSFALQLRESAPARLRVEYAVEFVKAAGHRSRKVFKLAERGVLPLSVHAYRRALRFVDLSTRRHHPGRHRIALLVNGRELAAREFMVVRRRT